MTVHGADRLGIVARLAGVIAEAGGNITDLSTRLSGALYVLLAEVDLPRSADVMRCRLGSQTCRLSWAWIRQCDCWRTINCEPDIADTARGPGSGCGPCAEPRFVGCQCLVDPADPAVGQLCADLVATMRVSPGCVGLAAPQVG